LSTLQPAKLARPPAAFCGLAVQARVAPAGVVMATREPRLVGTHCFGRPEAFVEVRLVDDEGHDVPEGSPGELLVRSAGPDRRDGSSW